MTVNVLLSILMLLVLLLVLLLITHRGKPRVNKAHFEKKWKKITEQTDSRSAISEADELLEEALKKVGIKGGTTGERLNNSVGFLRNINGAWAAHKLHNQIVNDNEFIPSDSETKSAIRQYKRALKDLGAL